MSNPEGKLTCPHCGADLKALSLPDNTGWPDREHWVCFNDECPYFQEGWAWMWDHYEVKASYRYRVSDPGGRHPSPLPVWSRDALKDRIANQGNQE